MNSLTAMWNEETVLSMDCHRVVVFAHERLANESPNRGLNWSIVARHTMMVRTSHNGFSSRCEHR